MLTVLYDSFNVDIKGGWIDTSFAASEIKCRYGSGEQILAFLYQSFSVDIEAVG